MQRYYFVVRFIPKKANLALLTGRCISVMHGYICKHNIQGFGVSFPAWSQESIGNTIAFVHTDKEILQSFTSQPYFLEMLHAGFFELSLVLPVPDSCREVRFKRNQAIAKMFVGERRRRLIRLKKRANARGDIFNPAKIERARNIEPFHCIALCSKSTEQDFLLHVQKEIVSGIGGQNFNQYGLATNKEFRGTVPELASVDHF